MSILDDLADALARDAIDAAAETGDEQLIDAVAKQLGASSQTMEEAYLTSVRVRLSEQRARRFLEERLLEAREGPAAGSDG